MYRLFLIATLCFISFSVCAQSSTADAEKLYDAVKKLPSYKEQIAGEKEKEEQYQKLYQQVLKDLPKAKDEFSRFYVLSQLVLPVNDNHLYLYRKAPIEITKAFYTDKATIKAYRNSVPFKEQLVSRLNLDSLYKAKLKAPADSVEGVYYYDDKLTMALYRTTKRDSLVGVVVKSELPTWEPGQITMILKEYKPNRFRAYHHRVFEKQWGLIANEKYLNNMLTEWRWKKFPKRVDHIYISPDERTFQFKNLNANTQYMRLGSFATLESSLVISREFFKTIKDSVTAPTLILDLRNNGGGGDKASDQFLNLIKDYTKRGRVFALVNNRTYSNGEQFTYHLMQLKNITILGETTNGTLTYGNNSGTTVTLPSGIFNFYITDMYCSWRYLPYESVGIKPQVSLKPDSDWIQQTLTYIANQGSNKPSAGN